MASRAQLGVTPCLVIPGAEALPCGLPPGAVTGPVDSRQPARRAEWETANGLFRRLSLAGPWAGTAILPQARRPAPHCCSFARVPRRGGGPWRGQQGLFISPTARTGCAVLGDLLSLSGLPFSQLWDGGAPRPQAVNESLCQNKSGLSARNALVRDWRQSLGQVTAMPPPLWASVSPRLQPPSTVLKTHLPEAPLWRGPLERGLAKGWERDSPRICWAR